ncbi:MAG: polyphosphate kinase 2, partial [Thermoanaerobaculia bacterium]|nr:polyphosphate kinase 2 [Thermoanaerobaculia bacterium]
MATSNKKSTTTRRKTGNQTSPTQAAEGKKVKTQVADKEGPLVTEETGKKIKLAEGTALKNEKAKRSSERQAVFVKRRTLDYERRLRLLQVEMLKMQRHIRREGQRVVLLFEGRDAAGKGGTIKRIIQHINPRGARVVALEKPSETERQQWYFQRYVSHLPTAGEIVLFDRSWYNRAMVEPIMGFCTDEQNKRFLKDVPLFEQLLVKDGIRLFKFYFSVSKKEQLKRFNSRQDDMLKQHKISPVDKMAQDLWKAYTIKKFQMLSESNRTIAPWTIIRSDNKKKARLNCMSYLLSQMEYEGKTKDEDLLRIESDIVISGIDELK